MCAVPTAEIGIAHRTVIGPNGRKPHKLARDVGSEEPVPPPPEPEDPMKAPSGLRGAGVLLSRRGASDRAVSVRNRPSLSGEPRFHPCLPQLGHEQGEPPRDELPHIVRANRGVAVMVVLT